MANYDLFAHGDETHVIELPLIVKGQEQTFKSRIQPADNVSVMALAGWLEVNLDSADTQDAKQIMAEATDRMNARIEKARQAIHKMVPFTDALVTLGLVSFFLDDEEIPVKAVDSPTHDLSIGVVSLNILRRQASGRIYTFLHQEISKLSGFSGEDFDEKKPSSDGTEGG